MGPFCVLSYRGRPRQLRAMKLPDFTTWLAAGQDFVQGVALYAAARAPSKTYQRLFALGATEYSRQVLLRELRVLAATGPAEVAAPSPTPSAAPVAAPTPPAPEPPRTGPANPLLTDLRQQLRGVRDERSHLHPQLTAARAGQKARYAVAARIVALTGKEMELRDLEAHVVQHGRLPGPVATDELRDTGELRRRLQNRLSQRSKLRKQPEQADKLATIEAEIILIRSKLKL